MSTSILFFLKEKFLHPVNWILQKFQIKERKAIDLQKDVLEIKKAAEQGVQDQLGMNELFSQIKMDQGNFVRQFEAKFEALKQDITKSLEDMSTKALEEMFLRNEMKYTAMTKNVGGVLEEIHSMKNLLERTVVPPEELNEKTDEEEEDDNFDETDRENRTRENGSVKKNGSDTQFDMTKLISAVKMCLTDLLKDAKLHLSVDREEENRELQIILTNLAEDRENIKKTILQAFSIVAEQAKKNYDQFGQIGHDTLQYVAVLNDNTNKLLRLKLDETDDALNSILTVIKQQNLHIIAHNKTLEKICGQIVEFFEKLKQDYQTNLESNKVTALMERTSENWMLNTSKLESIAEQICDDTKHMKQMLKDIKNFTIIPAATDTDNECAKEEYEIVHSESADSSQIQTGNQENVVFVYTIWERMKSLTYNVGKECHLICKLINGLEQKLGSLNESIQKFDEFVRRMDLDILAEWGTVSMNDSSKIIDSILQRNSGDAGDGHSRNFEDIASKLAYGSLVRKIQNADTDNEMKTIEMMLRKIQEKRNCQDRENLKPSSEES